MSSGDKHLDAEWKRIQKKTFTRWTNEHLKAENLFLEDLTTDLSDGVRMIVLIEVLSHKKLGRYNKKPRVYAQKMENVQMALDFLMKKERIRLVNIGSGDIVDKNLKLILGLIWTLILHYQISMGFGIGDDRDNKATPKQALMSYLQGLIPDVEVNNLTKDWNDGTKIAAVVDAMAPGLCPEHADMKPENALENATLAMKLAEDWLGVPMVLEPKDMCNPNVDELSMMTYLSQFPEAKLKPGAPIKTRAAADKVKVYGPGVEGNLDTNAPSAEFTIDVTAAGGPGKPSVSVTSPEGALECSCDDNKDGTFSCAYIPTVPGNYTVCVDYDGKPAAKSPYQVTYSGLPVGSQLTIPVGDLSKVKVEGLETELVANRPTEFVVDATAAGPAEMAVEVTDASGAPVATETETLAPQKWKVKYTPTSAGRHTVGVKYCGQDVPDSPFAVSVCDPSAVQAYGPGLEGATATKEARFTVDASEAGSGALGLVVSGPTESKIECKETSPGKYEVCYVPTRPGIYKVDLKFAGEDVKGSVFRVPCEGLPPDASKCVVRGLETPGSLTVDCSEAGGTGSLEVGVCGAYVPAEFVSVKHNGDYTFSVTYDIPEPGETQVSVKWHGQHLTGSPFTVITQ